MKLFSTMSLLLACLIINPFAAAALENNVERYSPPNSLKKHIYIRSYTQNTVTLRFEVMSIIGDAKDVTLKVKLSGFEPLVPVPSDANFPVISEGNVGTLDFVLPITKEIANSNKVSIKGKVEYTPDYNAIIKYVENNAKDQYPNDVTRELLIDSLVDCSKKGLKSVYSVKFLPQDKYPGEPYVTEEK